MKDDTGPAAGAPVWAHRMWQERKARGWSQRDAVRAMRAHSPQELAQEESLLRSWKRWEKGETEPDGFNRPLIAKTFGTVTAAMFPRPPAEARESEILSATGMDTLEIVSRLRTSDVEAGTLDAVLITVERLCSEYVSMPPEQLLVEGRQWLRRLTELLHKRLTLRQHQEVLRLAGYLALLVGCVEYDTGLKDGAEATRQAALSLGEESGSSDVVGGRTRCRPGSRSPRATTEA